MVIYIVEMYCCIPMPSEAAFMNGRTVGSGESESVQVEIRDPSRRDVDNLNLSVTRASSSYDLNVYWQDANGNDVEKESVATGVSSGTQTQKSLTIRSPYAKIEVADESSTGSAGSGDADLVAFMK